MNRQLCRHALLLVAASLLLPCAVGRAQPRPSITPVRWELTFQPFDLQQISVATRGGTRNFWYLPYRVVNNSGDDVDFLPLIERVGEIDSELPPDAAVRRPDVAARMIVQPAIIGGDPAIFRAIKQRLSRTHPLLLSPIEVIGRIRQGLDNARESVAIFEELDPRVNRFTLYVGGLSGERQILPNPLFRARSAPPAGSDGAAETPAQAQVFVVQKTLALPYTLPGDVNTRRYAVPALGRLDWVMR
ncbi:MAG: hypothetical protein U1A27_10425 [Phycisphaerae bacterium]